MKKHPKPKKDSGSGCLVTVIVALVGPWLVSLAAIPLTGSLAEGIAWLSARCPWSAPWSPYFAFTAMFLIGAVLIAPLRLTHLEARRLLGLGYLLAPFVEMLLAFVIVRAASHGSAGWSVGDLRVFYPSSGVVGKLLVSLLILIVQFIACGVVMFLAARCFLKLVGVYIEDPGKIPDGRTEEPWHDRLRNHNDFYFLIFPLGGDLLVYVPSLLVLSIVHRASGFMMTALVSLAVARVLSSGLFEIISACLDWRSDRLAERLCGELADPTHAGSRLAAVRQLAAMNEAIISGEAQITAVLEDSDPAVREEAARALDKIEETRPYIADRLVNGGDKHFEKGRYSQAVKIYTRAIEMDPASGEAYCKRGLAYSLKRKHDLAIADHTEAIRLYPKHAGFYNARGLSYFEKGDYDLAITDYSEAIRLDPEDVQVRINRCEAYAAKGDYDKAWEDMKICRMLDAEINPVFLVELRKASGREE